MGRPEVCPTRLRLLLKQAWQNLCERYHAPLAISEAGWQELSALYTAPGRYYHTWGHIQSLLKLAQTYHTQLQQPDIIHWAIWYHDAIYDPTGKDNEAQSAVLAEKRLTQLNVPVIEINHISTFIRATTHRDMAPSANPDLDFFLDLDLSILGSEPKQYQHYTQAVRREYQMFSDADYQAGRSQALAHFLALPWIYRTTLGRELWEAQARQNLKAELGTLKQEA